MNLHRISVLFALCKLNKMVYNCWGNWAYETQSPYVRTLMCAMHMADGVELSMPKCLRWSSVGLMLFANATCTHLIYAVFVDDTWQNLAMDGSEFCAELKRCKGTISFSRLMYLFKQKSPPNVEKTI